MKTTENLNVDEVLPIISPINLKKIMPASSESLSTVKKGRSEIKDILNSKDDRLLVVVGPCSIHDQEVALDYAKRLKKLADYVSKKILIVMRVYFEKPRTTIGWKGLINDPDIDGTHKINKGSHTLPPPTLYNIKLCNQLSRIKLATWTISRIFTFPSTL